MTVHCGLVLGGYETMTVHCSLVLTGYKTTTVYCSPILTGYKAMTVHCVDCRSNSVAVCRSLVLIVDLMLWLYTADLC